MHCCPKGYKCSPEGSCEQGGTSIPWLKKTPALVRVTSTSQDVKCDDETSCPDENTCCRLLTGAWGCCPAPEVRSVAGVRLLAPGLSRKLQSGCQVGLGCDGPWSQHAVFVPIHFGGRGARVTRKSARAHHDCHFHAHFPSGAGHGLWVKLGAKLWGKPETMTARLQVKREGHKQRMGKGRQGCSWRHPHHSGGLCFFPAQATCCPDHIHCCPKGSKCDLTGSSCLQGSTSIPWLEKTPALRRVTSADQDVKCNSQQFCPDGNTCCRVPGPQGQWTCCPLPQVCEVGSSVLWVCGNASAVAWVRSAGRWQVALLSLKSLARQKYKPVASGRLGSS